MLWREVHPHDQCLIKWDLTPKMLNWTTHYKDPGRVIIPKGVRCIVECTEPPEKPGPFDGFAYVNFVDYVPDCEKGARLPTVYLQSPRDIGWSETIPDSGWWERPALVLGTVFVTWKTSLWPFGKGLDINGEYVMIRDYANSGQRQHMVCKLGRDLQPALKAAWHFHRKQYRENLVHDALRQVQSQIDEVKRQYPDFVIGGEITHRHISHEEGLEGKLYW